MRTVILTRESTQTDIKSTMRGERGELEVTNRRALTEIRLMGIITPATN